MCFFAWGCQVLSHEFFEVVQCKRLTEIKDIDTATRTLNVKLQVCGVFDSAESN